MGGSCVPDFAPTPRFLPWRFLQSQILCRLYKKSFEWDCKHAKKSHTHVEDPVWWIMETQNNPACTESVRVFKMLRLDRIQKKRRKSVRSMTSSSRDVHEKLTRMNDLVTGEVRCMSKRFVTLITAERLFTCKEKTGFSKWWTAVKMAKYLQKQLPPTFPCFGKLFEVFLIFLL